MHGSIPGMQSCAAPPISVALSGDTMGAQNLRAPTVHSSREHSAHMLCPTACTMRPLPAPGAQGRLGTGLLMPSALLADSQSPSARRAAHLQHTWAILTPPRPELSSPHSSLLH